MLTKTHRTCLIGVLAAAALLVALAGCGGGEATTSSSSSSPTGEAAGGAAGAKFVRVFEQRRAPSPSPADLHAALEEGELPRGTVAATVLTDEECEPDQQGISHCRNEARLAGGEIVVLRHSHDMDIVPCLTPGEPVTLSREF